MFLDEKRKAVVRAFIKHKIKKQKLEYEKNKKLQGMR